MTRLEQLDARRLVAADKVAQDERNFETMALNYEAARLSLAASRREHQDLVDMIRLVKKLEAS